MKEQTYLCRTLSADGKVITESIRSDSIELLRETLYKKGSLVLDIKEQNRIEEAFKSFNIFKEKVTASDISLLSKELAVLIKAGLPMSTCLTILSEHSAKIPIKNALISVKKDIEGGGSLSEVSCHNARPGNLRRLSSEGDKRAYL